MAGPFLKRVKAALCGFPCQSQLFLKEPIMATKKEVQKVGLELLDDECLAQIVEADVQNHQEVKSREAAAAFAELARRSGLEGW